MKKVSIKNELNNQNLVLSQIKYTSTFIDVGDDFKVYKDVYYIQGSGLIRERYERIDNSMNDEVKTTIKILSRKRFMVKVELIQTLLKELMHLITNANEAKTFYDDRGENVEIIFKNNALRLRADRGLSDGYTTIGEIMGNFVSNYIKVINK